MISILYYSKQHLKLLPINVILFFDMEITRIKAY